MLYLIILVILCLFFLFIAIMGVRTWRVVHLLAAIFVFAAAVGYMTLLARTAKTNITWKGEYNRLTNELDRYSVDNNELLDGKSNELEYTEDSLRGLDNALTRAVYGRGRVWRACRLQNPPQNRQFTLRTPQPARDAADDGIDPTGDPADTPTANNEIVAQSLLYVFGEARATNRDDPEGGSFPVPAEYIGEFRVTNVTPDTVTIEPLQTFARLDPNRSFTLYEMMPIDAHDVFAGATPEQIAQKLAPQAVGMTPGSREYQSLIDQYRFDGMSLTEIGKLNESFDPDPEDVLVEIRFLKDYKAQVDYPEDAESSPGATLDEREFDSKGRTRWPALKNGGDVEFKAGDTVLLDRLTAELGYQDVNNSPVASLIEQGICEKTDTTAFQRKLHDFVLEFRERDLQINLLGQEIESEKRDIADTDKAYDFAQSQITSRNDQIEKTNEDIDLFSRDLKLAKSHRADLEKSLLERRKRIDEYYLLAKQLAAQKAEIENWLTEQIDKNTEAALAAFDN